MSLTAIPKFLMVNYAPGAAGKFLTSLLMSSPSLAHFDPEVEHNKSTRHCVEYIQKHFPRDITEWIIKEPNPRTAWNLHFFSSKYPRGDNLTIAEFFNLSKEHATDYFCQSVNQQKIIPSVWHKVTIPEFLADSMFVTIIIDPLSTKWYHRALWNKAYGYQNGRIHIKENDPALTPIPYMSQYFQKFNNPIYSDEKFFTFIKNNIINSNFKKTFMFCENFQQSKTQEFVLLSELLTYSSCYNAVTRICEKFNLEKVPDTVILKGHQHWMSCHKFKYSTPN